MSVRQIRNVVCVVIICGVVVLLVGCGADDDRQADVPPSYKLEVGQLLTYEGSSKFTSDRDSMTTTTKSEIWVVRQNPDGGWHCIARNRYNDRIDLACFDLAGDGRIEAGPYPAIRNIARQCFVVLARDPNRLRTGWQAIDEEEGKTYSYTFSRKSRPDKGRWVFERVTGGPVKDIYGISETSMVHFDAERGLVERIESRYTQTYGFVGKGEGLTRLRSVKAVGAESVNRLLADTDAYFSALESYGDVLSTLAEDPNSVDGKLAQAKDVLVAVRDRIVHPLAKEELERRLAGHDERIGYLKERAKKQAAVLNRPSPVWETTDLRGQPYSMEALRGKVVVLDFWYRGCGWCIRAMPQIKQVAEHFADRPVAVLGMNIDEDPNDAEFVMDTMELNYPNLKARGIPAKYGVRGYPTLVVIDRQGVVRRFHVGYTPRLSRDLIGTIEQFLPPTTSGADEAE
jgi:thiol-disulfide isomerase/thioredoxin